MSKFMQVYEPVEEGWGAFLYKFASFVLPRPLNVIKAVASNMMLKKLLNDAHVKKYLHDECKKLLEEEKKKDPTVTAKLPYDPITLVKRWWHSNDGVGPFSRPAFMHDSNNLLEDKVFNLGVNGFTTTFWYDSDHIDAAVVLFYSKKHDKCIGRRIPTPKSGEVAKKFKEE